MGPRRRRASLGPQVVAFTAALGRGRGGHHLWAHGGASRRQGSGAAAGPGGAEPDPPAAAAGLRKDEGRNTSFNFQGPNISFKGGARVVNDTLNRSNKTNPKPLEKDIP